MTLFFITGSDGKFAEVKRILPDIEKLKIDLPEIQEIDARKIIEAKLQAAFDHRQGEFMVEDTSLYMECLNGLPGPLIKWFLQTIGKEGLAAVADKFYNSEAYARTIIGYARSSQEIHFFEGECRGEVVYPRGENGFGWDQIFQPVGDSRTFGEMTREDKDKFSMRRIAAEKLKKFLA